jgi:beta-lactamase class A
MSLRAPLRAAAAAVLAVCLAAASACASAPRPRSFTASVDAALRQAAGRDRIVAVAYCDLATGETLLRNERVSFHAASTIKVPVMVALFAAAESGELTLGEKIAIKNEFSSLVDGSPFRLDPKDDSDPDLYAAAGQTRPVDELIERMIDKSSNLATNLLLARIGASRVTDAMRALEVYDLVILRGVEDGKAFAAGLNNRVTANDLMILLRAVAAGKAASPADSARMVQILEGQEFNEKIPAGLPPGVRVAHKTGDITGVHHDAAIVYPPAGGPYVLVVLTAGFQEEKAADAAIAAISRAVWEARQARQAR